MALPLLLVARALLATIPFRLVRALAQQGPRFLEAFGVNDVAWAVGTAAGLTRAHSSCLPEAIAARALLRATATNGELRFNVVRTDAGVSARAFVTLLPARAAPHA